MYDDVRTLTADQLRADGVGPIDCIIGAPMASGPSTASSARRPARISRPRTRGAAGSTENGAPCSSSTCGWCERCDPFMHSLKTFLASGLEESTGFSSRWKRWATPEGRSGWALGTPERRTGASDSGSCGAAATMLTPTAKANMASPSMAKWAGHWGGLLPTPAATEYGSNKGGAAGRTGPERPSLRQMLGTPTKALATQGSRPLSEQAYARGITGTAALLTLVEWMLGYPPRWLLDAASAVPVSPPMATRSSQHLPSRSHGRSTPSISPTCSPDGVEALLA